MSMTSEALNYQNFVERRNAEASLYLEGASGNTETNNQARIGFDVMIRWMEGKKAQGVTLQYGLPIRTKLL
ncbi:hypothetical protein DKB98_14675 [Enterococcus faecalis]|nr:hypothetical protein DKB98_14675 [Enterococcus faecalis]